jgi:hypothetical protein
VEDFALRLSTILSDLEMLGDPEDEGKAVRKFLRVLPRKFRHMASSIESLLDIKTMSIEELSGRLLVVEENEAIDGAEDSGGRLLLTEEEWRARQKRAAHDGSSGSNGGDRRQAKNRGKDRDDRRPSREGSRTSGGSKKDDACHYCGKKGHWARECRKKKREEEAHLAEREDDDADPALLLGVVELDAPAAPAAATSPPSEPHTLVMLNEERTKVVPASNGEPRDAAWYLDTGASNHMTGDRSVFAELDEAITGSVRFGDGCRAPNRCARSYSRLLGRATQGSQNPEGPLHVCQNMIYSVANTI